MLLGTISLHKIQFSFINFYMKQLMIRVSRVGYSVWLADQLQFDENEILVGINPYILEMIF
jgi:hypothetical protein